MYRLKLVRSRVAAPDPEGYGTKVGGPNTVADLARKVLEHEDQEVFLVYALDSGNRVCGYGEVSRGGVAWCDVDPKVVFRFALLVAGCTSIIVVHNHPSGDVTPSKEDNEVTRKLVEAGKILGLAVTDHMIIGDTIYSYAAAFGKL